MSLTINYGIASREGATKEEAHQLVLAARQVVLGFAKKGLVDGVGRIETSQKHLDARATDMLHIPIPDEPDCMAYPRIKPLEGWIFRVKIGKGCQPMEIGLCRYQETVMVEGFEVSTHTKGLWRLTSSVRTDGACIHGWDHYFKCHRAVVKILDELVRLGYQRRMGDDGQYWPDYSKEKLYSRVARFIHVAQNAMPFGMLYEGEPPFFIHKPKSKWTAIRSQKKALRQAREEFGTS